jgi:hypothetical protein
MTSADTHIRSELLRHQKTHGLPELPDTRSQLALICELNLPLATAALLVRYHL